MRAWFPVVLLLALFSLATRTDPWFESWAGTTTRQGNAMQMLLGDSRRMFANHFFVKADAYFHSGFYPSIYDNRESIETAHMVADAGTAEDHNTGGEQNFLGQPRDWIDAFSRKFFPSEHTHLDQGGASCAHGCTHNHGEHGADDSGEVNGDEPAGQAREILPWLKLSVELDPTREQSYVVAAYWLRERMGKLNEAEQFLREGLLANPDSIVIRFELGRLQYESRHDAHRAKQLWLKALECWDRVEAQKPEPDTYMLWNILSPLSHMEEEQGDFTAAYTHLKRAKAAADNRPLFDKRLQHLEQRLATTPH